jgi:hypothetical protein
VNQDNKSQIEGVETVTKIRKHPMAALGVLALGLFLPIVVLVLAAAGTAFVRARRGQAAAVHEAEAAVA